MAERVYQDFTEAVGEVSTIPTRVYQDFTEAVGESAIPPIQVYQEFTETTGLRSSSAPLAIYQEFIEIIYDANGGTFKSHVGLVNSVMG